MSQVAQTILAQLGGNRFLAMTGAKNLVGGECELQMNLPRNRSGANTLIVTLEGDDTYTLEFGTCRNLNYTVKATVPGVYADQLQAIFTDRTGLETRL